MSSRYSYRNRAAGQRFGMTGYRGGVFKRKRYVRKAVPMRKWPRGVRNLSEVKAIDTAVTMVADTTGAVLLLNGCIRGEDIGNRTARQISMSYLQIKMFTYVTSPTGIDQIHRCMVVQDMQSNGAAPAITDVLVSASINSQLNLDNRNRFRVLYDRNDTLNASAESGSIHNLKINIPLNAVTTFNAGNAGTIADIQTNSLYLISLGSVAAGATAGAINGTARVRFYDK